MVNIYVENCNINSCKCEKRLGIKIGNKLNFNNYIDEICKKSKTEIKCTGKGYPLHGLTKVAHVVESIFLISI